MSLFDPPPGPPPETPGPASETPGPPIRTVSALIAEVSGVLAETFPEVWVRGEISRYVHHGSGHMYFALKDESAVVSCVFFKFQQRGLRFVPKDGMEVEVRAAVEIYPPRGAFQLRVLEMRPAGIGALLLALEALKKRLAAEGLFDAARKRPLPRFPRAVGLVTSPTGAAIRDLLHVLHRRWPGLRIVLAPVPVQGKEAAPAIARAIAAVNRLGGLDVLIVGRGGGSLEDLWAFNEETTVRAVAASAIPVVSAVGHEVDVTLCDFVADARAATPSAAAEMVTTPDRATARRHVRERAATLNGAVRTKLAQLAARLSTMRRTYGFRRPADLLALFAQRVDEAHARAERALRARLARVGERTRGLGARVHPARLIDRIRASMRDRAGLAGRLVRAPRVAFAARAQRVLAARARLLALSPRAVLARGYSLVTLPDGTVVRSAARVDAGDRLAIEFARGRATARVLERTLANEPGED